MGLFKLRDRDQRAQWKNAHKAALKAAIESYAFWGETKSAYDQYCYVMQAWGERPVTYAVFDQKFPKAGK